MSLPSLVLRLCRAKMTVITAVTHLAAAIVSTIPKDAPSFSPTAYLSSWFFILVTQFMTHFFGEVHDLESDRLNTHATPLTGGSRVLAHNHASTSFALRLGMGALALSLLSLGTLVPPPARPLGLAMVALALAYTTPPVKLNYRALGELDAAVVTSVLVPLFSATTQGAVLPQHVFSRPMLQLIVPPFLAKIALFLALNFADRRADWVTGKFTLACNLGDVGTARLHAALLAAAYLSANIIAFFPFSHIHEHPTFRDATVLVFLLPAARVGIPLSIHMLRAMPYRVDALLPAILTHSTFMVWGIALHSLLLNRTPIRLFSLQNAFLCFFGFLTLRNMRKPRRERGTSVSDDAKQELPTFKSNSADNGSTLSGKPSNVLDSVSNPSNPPHFDTTIEMSATEEQPHPEQYDVVVVGAGVAGLVAALSLRALGRSVIVLERRERSASREGADLALWPGAISILRRLGVPSEFFNQETFPLYDVKMCNMEFEEGGAERLNGPPTAKILKSIDMDAVTDGTGEHFVLVSRENLMDALWALVPDDIVVFGARVVDVLESESEDTVTVSYLTGECDSENGEGTEKSAIGRLAIGADGSRSILREHINPTLGSKSAVRFCGEVCYRGVLSLDTLHADAQHLADLLPDNPNDGTMRINYGAGLRSSFGFLRSDGTKAYWWVKKVVSEMPESRGKLADCPWPEPLRSLHDLTPDDAFYMHPIEDSPSLPRWASPRVVVVGDAAHVVTPNMGQGACLATEDAFVLATELAKHWKWPDGHIEAFYRYQMCRKSFSQAVASESRKQLILGQLSSPITVWLRDFLITWVPTSVLIKKLRQNNFDVTPYITLFDELVNARDVY